MTKLMQLPEPIETRRQFGVFSDFAHYTTTEEFTTVASDSGAATVSDAVGGILALAPSDGTVADNDETYVRSTTELFKFADDKPLFCESLLKFAEANTDDANVMFGFMDAVAANAIVDNGGGPKASFSGAVLYKIDGGTVWIFATSIGTTKTTTTTQHTAGGSAYQRLKIECKPVSATLIECVPFLDGVQMKDASGNPIKHTVTLGSPTEMHLFVGVKNGDTNAESLLVDYLGGWQLR